MSHRFTVQEGAGQGLGGAGQGSQAVAQRSCLLAGPEANQTRKEGGPARGLPHVCIFKALPLCSPILRAPQRGSELSFPWNVLQPWLPWLNLASPLLPFPDPHLLPHPDSPAPALLQLSHSLSKSALSVVLSTGDTFKNKHDPCPIS